MTWMLWGREWKHLPLIDNNCCDWLAKLFDLSPIISILLLWPRAHADGCFWGPACGHTWNVLQAMDLESPHTVQWQQVLNLNENNWGYMKQLIIMPSKGLASCSHIPGWNWSSRWLGWCCQGWFLWNHSCIYFRVTFWNNNWRKAW